MVNHSTLRSSAAAVLLLAIAASGCSGSSVDAGQVRARALSAADAGGATALAVDELLTVTLDAQLSTGHAWQPDELAPAVLRLVSREHRTAGSLGGQDQEVLRFAGVSAGTTSLGLFYRRPWDAPGTGEQVYRVEVAVAGPYAGPELRLPAPAALEAVAAPAEGSAIPTAYNVCESEGGAYARCTAVKDQGSCGSCWAFATVGVLENLIHLADPSRSPAPDLSEQYLVSCNTESFSCKAGGSVVFRYFIDRWKSPPELEPGAVYEADFPYAGLDLTCGSAAHPHHEQAVSWGWAVKGFASSSQRVAAIQQAILDHGPVWVDICADDAFQKWKPIHGVFTGSCTTTNHAVVLVGWGSEGTQGYWILRNSWGPGWGDQGHMKIAWGANQVGSTAAYAVYDPDGNRRPVAAAGASQTVDPGAAVTLDGSASADADGAIQGYAWAQTAGPAVALSGAGAARATFTAPAVSERTVLSFRLTVKDDRGAEASAGTAVVVQDGTSTPVVQSGGGGGGGGCSSTGGGGWLALLAVALGRRRRR